MVLANIFASGKRFLRDLKKLVIHTAENLGGSGGFYLGEERALHLDADWVMIADDDAYPEPNYLEGMQKYIDHHDFQNINCLWESGRAQSL